MIKTFRGKLADGEEQIIRLSTKKGKIGYRITKFQMIGATTGTYDYGFVIKIFKVSQETVNATIDFGDGNLLAAGYIENHENIQYPSSQSQIIFEREIFNQDIFVTCKDIETGQECNYYIELEVMDLSDNAAAVSTLRDIRLNPQVGA